MAAWTIIDKMRRRSYKNKTCKELRNIKEYLVANT